MTTQQFQLIECHDGPWAETSLLEQFLIPLGVDATEAIHDYLIKLHRENPDDGFESEDEIRRLSPKDLNSDGWTVNLIELHTPGDDESGYISPVALGILLCLIISLYFLAHALAWFAQATRHVNPGT